MKDGNASALPPFYMYSSAALDHSWMRRCTGFAALRHSVNDTNTAEVGVHKVLHRHPARTFDASAAQLFYVPVFEYTSYSIGECNGTTHRSRMEAATASLHASEAWVRNGGGDHFFVTSAWSLSSTSTLSLAARMHPLNRALSCGIAGRYKAFGGRTTSTVATCTFEVPYQANMAATRLYRPRTDPRAPQRTTLLEFAGALDVCCTGHAIRCAIAPLYAAAASGELADVIVRPIIPSSLSQKPCTARALKLASEAIGRRATNSSAAAAARHAARHGRRLLSGVWRWSINNSDVDLMARETASSALRPSLAGDRSEPPPTLPQAREMTSSVFCLSPAGDNCVSARLFSAVAAGCLPVVICDHLPGAFPEVVPYSSFWIKYKSAQFIADPLGLVKYLRAMPIDEVHRRQDAMHQYRADILYATLPWTGASQPWPDLLLCLPSPSLNIPQRDQVRCCAVADWITRARTCGSVPEASDGGRTPRAMPYNSQEGEAFRTCPPSKRCAGQHES